jgi:hypothetical protein
VDRTRDFQRERVYKAEGHVEAVLKERGLDGALSLDEVKALVGTVTRSRYWKSKAIHNHAARGKPVLVKDGRARRRACAGWRPISGYYIAMPVRGRTRLTTLHELNHIAVYHNPVWHGREFARSMLAMTRRFLGKEAGDLLAEQYKVLRVKRVGRDTRTIYIHYIPRDPIKKTVTVEVPIHVREQ